MKRTIIDTKDMELEDHVVVIKRVTKVVKGGRNMRFTALVVVGDKNGHVGAGLGKATEIPEATTDNSLDLSNLSVDELNELKNAALGEAEYSSDEKQKTM